MHCAKNYWNIRSSKELLQDWTVPLWWMIHMCSKVCERSCLVRFAAWYPSRQRHQVRQAVQPSCTELEKKTNWKHILVKFLKTSVRTKAANILTGLDFSSYWSNVKSTFDKYSNIYNMNWWFLRLLITLLIMLTERYYYNLNCKSSMTTWLSPLQQLQ